MNVWFYSFTNIVTNILEFFDLELIDWICYYSDKKKCNNYVYLGVWVFTLYLSISEILSVTVFYFSVLKIGPPGVNCDGFW